MGRRSVWRFCRSEWPKHKPDFLPKPRSGATTPPCIACCGLLRCVFWARSLRRSPTVCFCSQSGDGSEGGWRLVFHDLKDEVGWLVNRFRVTGVCDMFFTTYPGPNWDLLGVLAGLAYTWPGSPDRTPRSGKVQVPNSSLRTALRRWLPSCSPTYSRWTPPVHTELDGSFKPKAGGAADRCSMVFFDPRLGTDTRLGRWSRRQGD